MLGAAAVVLAPVELSAVKLVLVAQRAALDDGRYSLALQLNRHCELITTHFFSLFSFALRCNFFQ